jgi:radical SAM protein with 4Fe4S-binding SPASM domain
VPQLGGKTIMADNHKIGLEELCIEVTGQCMMNCVQCSSSSSINNPLSISLPKYRELLQEAKQLGTKIIELSGGEPLLHPLINTFIEEAASNFKVRLYTSGFLGKSSLGIPNEQLLRLAAQKLDRIIFNLQGATAQTHEKITRAKGSYASVVQSIKSAKAAGLWSGVHFVPMKANYVDFRAIAKLCSELKVDELAVLRFVGQGRGKKNRNQLELNQKEFNQFIQEVVQIKKQFGGLIQIRTGCPMNFCSMIDKTITPARCKAGHSTLLISYDGSVVPCPAFKHADDFNLGNIYNESLDVIWNQSKNLKLLRELNVMQIDGCNTCRESNYCQGRCVAQRFYKYGSIYHGPDPLCPYQKSNQIPEERPLKQVAS